MAMLISLIFLAGCFVQWEEVVTWHPAQLMSLVQMNTNSPGSNEAYDYMLKRRAKLGRLKSFQVLMLTFLVQRNATFTAQSLSGKILKF